MAYSPRLVSEVDAALLKMRALSKDAIPRKGWVRTLRSALRMSARQLAARMGTQPPRVFEIEKDEVRGAVTIQTLQRAAAAMGCEFVYAIVPKGGASLEQLLASQAGKIAKEKLRSVGHTMSLEAQSVETSTESSQLEEMVRDLVTRPPRWFWDRQ